MTEWRQTTLGEVITLQRGFDLTEKEATAGPYPVISSSGQGYTTDVARVEGPGVITGRKGVLGKVHFSPGPYWPHDTTLWVKDFKGAEPRFVYYLLQALPLASLDAGASNPTLNRNHAHLLPVKVPGRKTQARISNILGVLDDLIENNRRRIEVLEGIVTAIYREWFVHFRYPGYQHATFVGSSLGSIPAGWVLSTCGDELISLGGGTPSKSEPAYWDGGTIRWYTPSDLTKSRCRYSAEPELRITEAGLARSSARLFPPGSVLMTSRATLGVLTIATTAATTNQGFIVIPPDKRWSPAFILQWLGEHAAGLASIATGATFKEITKGAFKRVPFLVPQQDVLDAHRAATDPVEQEIRNLEQQVRSLASLRDLLLPKLVTGQIDVSSLDDNALAEDSVP
jgi:type I restriction enzyme S subunit